MTTPINITATVEHISDRIKDPFLGSYSFFFLTLNWRLWLVLFSGEAYGTKLMLLESNIYYNCFQSIWMPLCFSFGFHIIIPILRTSIRVLNQFTSQLDSKILKKVMDEEKLKLVSENEELKNEKIRLMEKVSELLKAYGFSQYFISQNSDYAVRINNDLNKLQRPQGGDAFFSAAHEMAKAHENLRVNLANTKIDF